MASQITSNLASSRLKMATLAISSLSSTARTWMVRISWAIRAREAVILVIQTIIYCQLCQEMLLEMKMNQTKQVCTEACKSKFRQIIFQTTGFNRINSAVH